MTRAVAAILLASCVGCAWGASTLHVTDADGRQVDALAWGFVSGPNAVIAACVAETDTPEGATWDECASTWGSQISDEGSRTVRSFLPGFVSSFFGWLGLL